MTRDCSSDSSEPQTTRISCEALDRNKTKQNRKERKYRVETRKIINKNVYIVLMGVVLMFVWNAAFGRCLYFGSPSSSSSRSSSPMSSLRHRRTIAREENKSFDAHGASERTVNIFHLTIEHERRIIFYVILI